MTDKDLIYLKGSSWIYDSWSCRCANRGWKQRDFSYNYGGFRIMLRKKTEIPS